VGDPAFNLTATASSGLPVSYVSGSTSVATISGSTVTVVGAGTSVITASQAGDGNYLPATPVDQPLNVSPAVPPPGSQDVPLLPWWALLALGGLLVATASKALSRQKPSYS
jgi:hypothetical protein